MGLERNVCVVVPVYNGVPAFRALVTSLRASHAAPHERLKFLFIDDASTDADVTELFAGNDFFRRPDVRVVRREANGGFVRTANQGFALAPTNADVLLLNADTQVWGNAIEILQRASLRFSHAASITPLSNNATLASLWGWPDGISGDLGWAPSSLTESVERAGITTPEIEAPTGVGFCLYLPRRALTEVGAFDEVAFGRGYGEENDWCQRAIRKGFIHLVCTETYVHHEGSQSFETTRKAALLKRNLAELGRRYPSYHADVQRYIHADPLGPTRAMLTWQLSRTRKQQLGLSTVTLMLHKDPETFSGGTERHAKALGAALVQRGHEVCFLFPVPNGWRLRVLQSGFSVPLHDFAYPERDFASVFEQVRSETSVLHVHHLRGASDHVLAHVARAQIPKKVFTAHDYWALCPSVTLLDAHARYCGLPTNADACNRCLATRHHHTHESIEAYRARTTAFLDAFDEVRVPSNAARDVLMQGLNGLGTSDVSRRVQDKLRVVPNMLEFADQAPRFDVGLPRRRKLVFLGGLSEPKGGGLLAKVAPSLRALGFDLEVWGQLPAWASWKGVVWPYTSWEELSARAQKDRPYAVALPFLWPETFSFTTYEALCVMGVPVVVGPHGNPAQLVEREGVGVIMRDETPEALVEAFRQLTLGYPDLSQRVRERQSALVHGLSSDDYLHASATFLATPAVSSGLKPPLRAILPDAPRAGADATALLSAWLSRTEQSLKGFPGGEFVWKRAIALGSWLLRDGVR